MLSERAHEIERLRDRIATLDQALDREHTRRAAAEKDLEGERAEALNLRSQAGRLRAELDLARAGQSETDSISAELDTARRALRRERAEAEQLRARLAQAESALGQPRPRTESAAVAQPEPAVPARLRRGPESAEGRPRAQAAAVTAPVVRERPLNPSLRSRTNWLGRILAVLIMLAVIAAIILVIRTTVSP